MIHNFDTKPASHQDGFYSQTMSHYSVRTKMVMTTRMYTATRAAREQYGNVVVQFSTACRILKYFLCKSPYLQYSQLTKLYYLIVKGSIRNGKTFGLIKDYNFGNKDDIKF